MIKPGLNPSPSSIKKWAYQKSKQVPLPHWDEIITSIENGDILLTLASDKLCPQRAYVLHCLYLLVGNSASKHVETEIRQINLLLAKASPSDDPVIFNWAARSRVILSDLRKYDYVEWCKGGFVQKDLPVVQQTPHAGHSV